jgi:hypothetical protein
MADEDRLILDRLAGKHELLSIDPTDPETTQVVRIERAGRTLEVRPGERNLDTSQGRLIVVSIRPGRFDRVLSGPPGLS